MSDTTAATCPVCEQTYTQLYYNQNDQVLGCNSCFSDYIKTDAPVEDLNISLLEQEHSDWKSLKDKNTKLIMENTKLKQEIKSLRGSVMRAWEDEAAKYIIEGAASQDPSAFKSEVPTFACIAFEFFAEYIVAHDAIQNSEILRPLAEDVENSLYSFYNKAAADLLGEEDKTHDWFVKEEEEDGD